MLCRTLSMCEQNNPEKCGDARGVSLIRRYRCGINIMVIGTTACARRTGAASQAFERMHSTLSHA